METKNFCIKIDKKRKEYFYDPVNRVSILEDIDYADLEWYANNEYHLDSFETKDYVYIYSENLENLKAYIDYIYLISYIYLDIEQNVQLI